jgi:hypothetical protein
VSFVEARLWLDSQDAERDERIGEHECYLTLFDLANNRYLGNSLWWSEALEGFFKGWETEADPNGLREVIRARLRVVSRCHCDPVWCRGEEWTGSQHEIVRDRHNVIDYAATADAAIKEWRGHVEELRAGLDARHAAAALARAGHLVALDQLAELDPMERHGAIRTARSALDAVELDAVIASRRQGRSWTEIGVELGISKQAARERFVKHDPTGAIAP